MSYPTKPPEQYSEGLPLQDANFDKFRQRQPMRGHGWPADSSNFGHYHAILPYYSNQVVAPAQGVGYVGHLSNQSGRGNVAQDTNKSSISVSSGFSVTPQYQGGFGGNLRPGIESLDVSTTSNYTPSGRPFVPHISPGNHPPKDRPCGAGSTADTPSNDLCDCDLGCGLKYAISKTQHHLNQHHNNLERVGARIICPVHREWITEDNFARHIREVHHKREETRCPQCGKTISRKGNLPRHMKIHVDEILG